MKSQILGFLLVLIIALIFSFISISYSNEITNTPINEKAWFAENGSQILVIIWALTVIIGILMGFTEKITIYRDYDDLLLVFLTGLVPYVIFHLLGMFVSDKSDLLKHFILFLVIVSEVIIIGWFLIRTYQDNNGNILFSIISLITKITLSVLFIINLMTLLNPGGKTGFDRAKARNNAFFWLAIITPLVASLIKNKRGFLSPGDIIKGRGIRGIGSIRDSFKR